MIRAGLVPFVLPNRKRGGPICALLEDMARTAKRAAPPARLWLALFFVAFGCCRGDTGSAGRAPGSRPRPEARAVPLAVAPPVDARREGDRDGGPAATRYAVIVSIDGMAERFARLLLEKGKLPALQRLRQEGAFTHNARTDFFNTTTLPNHICMLTGVPSGHTPGFPETIHHGYLKNVPPEPGETLHNAGNRSRRYLPSVFDVAHDLGLVTCLFASKPKFSLFTVSYDETNGAPDPIPPDNGRKKIDHAVIDTDTGLLVDRFIEQQRKAPCHLSLLHLADPDTAGHRWGWGSSEYMGSLVQSDRFVGRLLDAVEGDPALRGRTALIVTSDHGGSGTSHHQSRLPKNYTIAFYLWGAGAPAGADLYRWLSPARKDPGGANPSYQARPPPIRNGDAGNLALRLLGLPPVPGSLMFMDDLKIRATTRGN
jgi:hypothetical protein